MAWKSVGVLGKPHAALQSKATFQEILDLFNMLNMPIYFEYEVGEVLALDQKHCFSPEKLVEKVDLVLVVGGDGSMLNAARLAVLHDKPVLGVNRGNLGFLTDIYPENLATQLKLILNGEYSLESRFLLEADLFYGHEAIAKQTALNDIVLSPGASSQLIEFDLWINKSFVCRQRADGVIVTTPTGSTAYALSAGGPILHPGLEAIAIVPMLPHKLTSRPIVINSNAQIEIILTSQHEAPARISFDSQRRFDLLSKGKLCIRPYAKHLTLVHPKDYDYFKTLRDKLYWESR